MWIARTKDFPTQIEVFLYKPHWTNKDGWNCGKDCDNFQIGRLGTLYDVENNLYPNLKDEPIEVELISSDIANKFKDYVLDKVKDDVIMEHTCDTCRFKNENPRCMKNIPCNEWRIRNNLKKQNRICG